METYKIVRRGKNWAVDHGGTIEGDYATKEAAFEVIALATSNAIKTGSGVTITIPARASGEDALGAERQ